MCVARNVKGRGDRFALTWFIVRLLFDVMYARTGVNGWDGVVVLRRRPAYLLSAGTEAGREDGLGEPDCTECAACEAVQKVGHAIST
jgi:hypothetical protein